MEGIELIDIKVIECGVPFVEVVLAQLFDLLFEVNCLVLFIKVLHLVAAVLLWLPVVVRAAYDLFICIKFIALAILV